MSIITCENQLDDRINSPSHDKEDQKGRKTLKTGQSRSGKPNEGLRNKQQ